MSEFELAVDGARWRFDPSGAIRGFARLAAERPVLDLSFPDASRDAWSPVEQHPAGITRLRRNGLSAELRPDSVLVLRATRPATVRVEALFSPQYAESAHGRRLVLDGLGGFGAFPTRPGGTGQAPSFEYALRTDDELWICVCPSRPASPVSAVAHIAHEGRFHPFPGGAYPSTQIIQDAARFCSVLALHAYFWGSGPRRLDLRQGRYALRRRPWTTARHVPADPGQFARVQHDVRRAGMKLVLYLSPRYSKAPDLFDEMRRVLDEYGADGLYLDRISDDFRRNDEVVRRTREILGPERILYLNASDEPFGTPRVYCPFTDAHADFVLRGDSGRGGLPLDRFLQFAVSGRNISNAVGVWCHYGSSGRLVLADRAPSARPIEAALRHGVRIWRRSVWGDGLGEFDRRYFGGVTRREPPRPPHPPTEGRTSRGNYRSDG